MLTVYQNEMLENGWDLGRDNEELFELAMHPEQFRAYKSGIAKKEFLSELDVRKKESCEAKTAALEGKAEQKSFAEFKPTSMTLDVNGEIFAVSVSYDENPGQFVKSPKTREEILANFIPIESPLEGKFYFTKDSSETAIRLGDKISIGDTIGYIESMKTFNAISSNVEGTIAEICYNNGEEVQEDAILVKLR